MITLLPATILGTRGNTAGNKTTPQGIVESSAFQMHSWYRTHPHPPLSLQLKWVSRSFYTWHSVSYLCEFALCLECLFFQLPLASLTPFLHLDYAWAPTSLRMPLSSCHQADTVYPPLCSPCDLCKPHIVARFVMVFSPVLPLPDSAFLEGRHPAPSISIFPETLCLGLSRDFAKKC